MDDPAYSHIYTLVVAGEDMSDPAIHSDTSFAEVCKSYMLTAVANVMAVILVLVVHNARQCRLFNAGARHPTTTKFDSTH